MKEDSNHKLKEQFVKSFEGISKEEWLDTFNDSIEQIFSSQLNDVFFDKAQDDKDLASLATKVLLHRHLWDYIVSFSDAFYKCGSPIEKAMFAALVILGRYNYGSVQYRYTNSQNRKVRGGDTVDPTSTLIIELQAQMGKHRVDFLLTDIRLSLESGKTNVIDFASGENITRERYVPIEKQIIVECDGHDFHERSKEQARKDKQRDRFLQSLGIQVFHYTGSEIWENVFKCAKEVFEALDKLMEKWKIV